MIFPGLPREDISNVIAISAFGPDGKKSLNAPLWAIGKRSQGLLLPSLYVGN